ncbi:MAG: winged helix-turn-helix transcriptional regulator [Spirochaetales bacterium]|nr:winged helix-turn-helix transcriptional regulator [Spirochaetales bacterium]
MSDKDFGPVLIGKLLNIGGMLNRKANQLLLPFGLNQQQFSILFEIRKAGSVNQSTMVNRLLLEKAHVSKVIKKLKAMKLIETAVSPDDRRSVLLSVTDKGSKVVAQCQAVISAWNKEWVDKIDPQRRAALLDNVGLLQDVFRRSFPSGGDKVS